MKTKTLTILCILIFTIQMILPITSNAYQLEKQANSETTMDVTLQRDKTDSNKINVIATDTTYNITELKYVNKYIEKENVDYFEQNNEDVKEFNITPSQRIETSFELEGYGSYTVYAKNEIGARFLSRITINDPNNAPNISLTKDKENPLHLTIKVTTPELNIVKLKIAKKDSINQEIDFSKEGTDIQFTQSNNVTVEYTNLTQEGLYIVYAEDEQGNKATSEIYLSNQNTPITANISEADESRNVKIEVTDSLCNITKIKVARESEIKDFDDFETKGEEIKITPAQNISVIYQAPEDDIYVFYIEDEAGYKKMVQKRITTQSKTIQVEISQDENDPRQLTIKATDTLSNITQLKIALGDNKDFKYFETEGEELEITPGRNITTTYTLNQNSKVNIFVQDESGYKYIYSTTISGIDIKPIEPPVITIEQNAQNLKQIDVTVLGIDDFIDEVKWAKGSQNAEYFKENGTTIGEGIVGKMVRTNFEIDEIGTYTVYAIDNSGNETVKEIEITSIETPEEPNPDPDPEPTPDEDTQPPEITFSRIIDKENNKVNITANIVDDKSQIEIAKVDGGIRDTEYFENNGIELNLTKGEKTAEAKFSLNQNGTYTIYVKDEAGNEVVKNFEVTEIETEPEPEPTPEEDKTPPTITGVEDGKTYKQSVTPKAEDENLKEVILIKDGKEVTNYKNGDTIESEGKYEITATDEAGNKTTIKFTIEKEDDSENNTTGGNTTGNNTTGGNTAGNNTTGGNTTGNNTTGGNTTGNNTAGGNTTGNNTTGENTTGNNTTGGSTTGNNTTGGNTIGNNTTGENTIGNNTIGGNTTGNNTTGGNITGNNTTGGSTTGNNTIRGNSIRNNATNNNENISNKTKLPYTGLNNFLIISIIILTICAIVFYFKYKKYNKM